MPFAAFIPSLVYLITFDTKFVNSVDISNYNDEPMYAFWQDGSFIRLLMPVNHVDRFHDVGASSAWLI
ncbi:hypothetical protein L1987_37685 [Smallanthus sonchifolius]|uniref:Uncharacterized protein n=1 Tax=Smallanthus sonchifolius TaxID=185202 RepID=A0ACB9HIF0_9ASTR|nr:hypothetical protein L1987_37685 [Smallanthus sonchifolius]